MLRARLRVVSVNDVYELTNLPRVATLLKQLAEARPADETLVVVAGDFVSPSLLSGIDHGRAAVAAMNALGATHACLGNHEADISRAQLLRRVSEFRGVWLNSNVPKLFPGLMPRFDVVSAGGGRRVGLVGLLVDDPRAFSDGTFKGLPIAPAAASARGLVRRMRDAGVDAVVAVTHQSAAADRRLAADADLALDVIVGGHDHSVTLDCAPGAAAIVKAGSDATHACVVDLEWDAAGRLRVHSRVEDVRALPPDPHLQRVVDRLEAPVRDLHADVLLRVDSRGLASERTRFQQTSMGRLLTSAVRDELGADAAVINGATIKGGAVYEPGRGLTLADLQNELPFPTKMVSVPLPGAVLEAAVAASRAGPPDLERRSYLQLDDGTSLCDGGEGLAEVGGRPFDPAATYRVALPRNLLKGFTDIAPLVEWADAHPELQPDEQAFVPALNLVLRHLARRALPVSFDELAGGRDVITRDDVRAALEARGIRASEHIVARCIAAFDENGDGVVERDEFAVG